MKCVEKDGVVERVSDDEAEVRLKQGWQYVPKHVWKAKKKGAT